MRNITITHYKIPTDDPRLGRHVLHDSRSLSYPVEEVPSPVSVAYTRRLATLDQDLPKPLGSCTGNATTGCVGTDPFWGTLVDLINMGKLELNEQLAIDLYSLATRLDNFAGNYPPNDTGSNGLSVAKAAVKMGLIGGYQHAFGIDSFISGMQTRPCITGTRWKTDMDEPTTEGIVRYSGSVRGGHEYEAAELDLQRGIVWFWNSWGRWGIQDPATGQWGKFGMSLEDYSKALQEDGDATFFTPKDQPAPTPTPNPVPSNSVDESLIAVMDPWAATISSHHTEAGKAKDAYESWKEKKGL